MYIQLYEHACVEGHSSEECVAPVEGEGQQTEKEKNKLVQLKTETETRRHLKVIDRGGDRYKTRMKELGHYMLNIFTLLNSL